MDLRGWWRRWDRSWLAVLAVALLALWPLLSRHDLPQNTDAELHIFRLAELSRVIRTGVFYPRWAPNFYLGYGYPIFNYYAPLSYYLGLPVELLPGLDAVDGVKFVLLLSLLAGAVGTFGFVRPHWGGPAGLVAAAAYTYAPYIQFVDPHARGDLAEVLALGLAPLIFWAGDHFLRHGGWRSWGATALLTAAVVTSHNLLSLVFFALLLAWACWQFSLDVDRARVGWLLAALALGVGLAAFFWLPVALEREAINLSTLLGAGEQDNFDFRNHYLGWRELLAPSARLDWGATEPEFLFNLGLMQWLLALVAIIGLLAGRAKEWRRLTFVALAAGGLVFMMLPISEPVWDLLPLIEFLQFPWRLLGPVAFLLAILAAAATQILGQWLPRLPWSGLHLGLILILAWPLSQPPPWPAEFGATDMRAVAARERSGYWLGTTSTSDFVPVTVDQIPRAQETVYAGLQANGPVDRVNRATLPQGTTVLDEQLTALHYRYQIAGEKAFPLRLFIFAFPGWEARVDGVPVETELGRPEGFLVVPVPAGDHTVDVAFRDTPARQAAWVLTALALLALIGGTVWLRRRDVAVAQPDVELAPTPAWLGWLALGLFGLAVVLTPMGWLHLASSGAVVEAAEHELYADLDGQIALLAYDLSSASVAPGETVAVTLYWRALRPLAENYQVYLHLFWEPAGGGEPIFWGQSDKINPGEFPTRRWPLDRYVRDYHEIMIRPDTGPGRLILRAGIWSQADGWRLPRLDATGRVIDDGIELTTLELEP